MVRGKKCGTLHDFAITNEPMNQKTPYLPYWFDTVLAKSPRTTRNKQNVYSNLYSQAVTHPSTNRSQPCLTSVIGRELVFSRWYGRRHVTQLNNQVSVESKKSENQDWYSRCFQGDICGKSRSGEPTWLYVCLTPEFEKCLEFDFTLYAKASGRCATWRTFPFDSGESYSPRYYYTGNIGQKPDFTFWSRKPSRVFLGILFRYGGTKLIRKLFVYNSYTLFWQKIRL